MAQPPADLEKRIERIQNGLLPRVTIKGEPSKTMKLADEMAEMHVPGVSVAVIHDGKIEWARGFGVTSLGGPSVTPDTLFQAASISKPVAALAVLKLVEAGRINLDTDVNQYLKSWKLPQNQFTEKNKVTVRELLTHTAGLTVHGFGGYASTATLPTLVQVLNGEKPANSAPIRVDTPPGTLWRYSGGGYVIAQQMLQDVAGEPFAKLMHDTVLVPIGMTRSSYEQPLPKSRLPEVATPYDSNGQPIGGPHSYPEEAPAGLWTTPSDLARYAIEVQKSLVGASNRVISAAMTHQMLTPGMNGWGLGPEVGGGESHRYFSHGGANEGYRCNLVAYNQGDGLVVMTNGDNGGGLAAEILGAVAKEYGWPDFRPEEHTIADVGPKILDVYVGSYQSQLGVFTVTRKNEQLLIELTGQPSLRLYPENDRNFFVKEFEARFTFETDAQGKATQLTLHQSGQDFTAKRIP
jgi:CubicO group peptidase (beta-lactamase class C family)